MQITQRPLREFTFFKSVEDQSENTEINQLRDLIETYIFLPSVVRSMKRPALVKEILNRSNEYEKEDLDNKMKFKVGDLKNILLENYFKQTPSRKRRKP